MSFHQKMRHALGRVAEESDSGGIEFLGRIYNQVVAFQSSLPCLVAWIDVKNSAFTASLS